MMWGDDYLQPGMPPPRVLQRAIRARLLLALILAPWSLLALVAWYFWGGS